MSELIQFLAELHDEARERETRGDHDGDRRVDLRESPSERRHLVRFGATFARELGRDWKAPPVWDRRAVRAEVGRMLLLVIATRRERTRLERAKREGRHC